MKVLQEEADEKAEQEVRQLINEKQGKTSKEAMDEKLDEFAKCKEFDELNDMVGDIMAKA